MSLGFEIRVYRSKRAQGHGVSEDELFAYWHAGLFPLHSVFDLEKEGRAVRVSARHEWAHYSFVLRACDLIPLVWPVEGGRRKPTVISEDRYTSSDHVDPDYTYREKNEFESLQEEKILIELTDDNLGYYKVGKNHPDWSDLL